jgi:hypothetical protein
LEAGFAMNLTDETIDATLDSNRQLRLTQQPRLPTCGVQVTIRVAVTMGRQRRLADAIREIAAEQRSRGFPGRSSDELNAEDEARAAEYAKRDHEVEAARGNAPSTGS